VKNNKNILTIAVVGLVLLIGVVAYSLNTSTCGDPDAKASVTCTSGAPTCGIANVASDQACPKKGTPCETCPKREECEKECPQKGPGCATCPKLDECEKKCAQQTKAAEGCPFTKACTTE